MAPPSGLCDGIRPGLDLRTRPHFGGFCGDPEQDSVRVVGSFKALYELADDVAGRLTHFR